jgi:uncharacterized protein with HEPN domain
MTSRLPKHLFDALAAARLAAQFCSGLDLPQYTADALVRSAVERQLEILGEAARRALDDSPDLGSRIPALALAVGLRNRIIHGYDRVENAIVLDTVAKDLPPLMAALEAELLAYPPPSAPA